MKEEYDFSEGVRGRFFRDSAKLRFPASDEKSDWAGRSGRLGNFIVREALKSLNAYREQPKLITEHARSEQDTAQGGYAHRQLFELVQNSADALFESPKGKSILIRLTEGFLYCADDGIPINEDGVQGLMFDRMSSKRSTAAIGRFGRGFKSVLGVTDVPEFYSRSGSFHFDKDRTAERISKVASAERYPVLRLPEPIDPRKEKDRDEELQELMSWATNIVRLRLKTGAHSDLAQQIWKFPPEFLLFVDHVRYLTLEDGEGSRAFMLHRQDGELRLDTGKGSSRWRCFAVTHRLSANARADWHLHNDGNDVTVSWAAPLDRLDQPGHFWAFFPTSTASLIAGILNAPWKTNEDRQNLLPGPYNEELIEAAAEMIADELPKLATTDDPARHLDALPRRHEAGDSEQADLLRKCLFSVLHERKIVPDQDGSLCSREDISYPPRELTSGHQMDTKPFERWEEYPERPRDWLHHKALTRTRLATVDRLFHPEGEPPKWSQSGAPRATIAEWLQALVKGKEADEAIQASMAAIQTAALIPSETRMKAMLGKIVLTASGDWQPPDPERIFLPDEAQGGDGSTGTETYVHPGLVSDRETLSALKKLGLKPPSPESRFRRIAKRVLGNGGAPERSNDLHREFWIASRKLPTEDAFTVIREPDYWGQEAWPTKLRVKTRAGSWQPLYSVLLPGDIVPGEGSQDDEATVDMDFHKEDVSLLGTLGVVDSPQCDRDLSSEESWWQFLSDRRDDFLTRPGARNPRESYLNFRSTIGSGPLEVLTLLRDEGRALYTHALLSLDATYEQWEMRHDTQDYPSLKCESPAVFKLCEHGRIRTPDGIVPFKDALGEQPNPAALQALLKHPKAARIKETFKLADPTPEFFGEGDAIPLTDVWPGLKEHLPPNRKHCRLVSCDRILVVSEYQRCVFHDLDVYLAGAVDDDERGNLKLVADALELDLSARQIEAILQRRTPSEVEERRAAIRKCSTDAERLLAAVGEQELRAQLPNSLLAVLESVGEPLTGTEIAEAAIATYHTDALRQYKWALDRIDPPSQWAGGKPAVQFVQSLGFSAEWAGSRKRRPEPFLEVEGRYRLPPLHPYQQVVVRKVRKMFRSGHSDNKSRRGMVSMPTGSGKTRVAVQAVVEAIRYDGFRGGVLWVADRAELCEQAVEAWRQVWSNIGPEAVPLRISRMWAGQPSPIPRNDPHVVVATIQTLNARLNNQARDYEFLADFRLVVFDEAHRSIAPTFTSVMEEIGLTRRQGVDEPFLLGLTATPYRGYNEKETKWLANRYGGNRFDTGAFDSDDAQEVIQELQSKDVLAQADHGTIEGETFPLDKDELRQIRDEAALSWLPPSAEKRIARSAERTKRIIRAYEKYIDPSWATLIFATSVEHAQTLAALLNRKSFRSRAVSAETETATRRRIVEQFRRGDVKALVNYGVFREGFDAPKTRAIIVARPVYSPNLYFQMIGRGLRGPLNGGDDRCLILNVRDNIENFDRKLAFSELDWLWA